MPETVSIEPTPDQLAEVQYNAKVRKSLRSDAIADKGERRMKQLAAELLREKENADAANKAKREFMSNVGLELRTPFYSIIGFSAILQKNEEETLSAQDISRAERVNRNGRQLLLIVDNVIDLAKLETDHGKLSWSP